MNAVVAVGHCPPLPADGAAEVPGWPSTSSGAPPAQRPQDRVEDRVQIPADVVGQEPQDEVAVLLKQLILSTVPSICDGIRQMLRTIQFQGEARVRAEEIDFQRA